MEVKFFFPLFKRRYGILISCVHHQPWIHHLIQIFPFTFSVIFLVSLVRMTKQTKAEAKLDTKYIPVPGSPILALPQRCGHPDKKMNLGTAK